MMNYSLEEYKKLSTIVDNTSNVPSGTYNTIFQEVIKTYSDPDNIIRDFIGAYVCGFDYEYSQCLIDFMELPKKSMPCYIASKNPYEKILSLWRLEIDR